MLVNNCITAFGLLAGPASATFLQVDSYSVGKPLSRWLHGLMFEDISNSGDGGIYSQLLRNNGFQGATTQVDPWKVAYGPATISYDPDTPLNDAIKASIKISVPPGSSGFTGVSNSGYRGLVIDGGYYNSTFWLKGTYSGDIKIRLVGIDSGIEWSWGYVHVESRLDRWTYYVNPFWTTAAPDGNNQYIFEFFAENVVDGSINLGYPTLFSPTLNNRNNGLKVDLSQTLLELQPRFLRFPGGNNLEGSGAGDRWKWNETLGPLETRRGRWGTWGYTNTDGLGLMEYFTWCEDMQMEPVLAVWAGLGLEYGGQPILVGAELDPYVDDTLKELEFILGGTYTPGGALRASLGHPEPYRLQFVEIGNEDNLSNGCATYPQRFLQFFNAIRAAYPQITVITSTADPACLPNPIPAGVWLDFHDYNVPENYVREYTFFDTWDRAHPVMIGEYARWGVKWSDMQGACSEAVYMMGWERNSDLVQMAAFAPTLQNYDPINGQWTPNLVPFQNKPNGIVKSISYHVLKMFSTTIGDVVLPVTADTNPGPVYWSANRKGADRITIKLANFGDEVQNVRISIPGKAGATASFTAIAAPPDAANTVDAPTAVVPYTGTIIGDGGAVFGIDIGQYGVVVLTV